MSILVNPFIFGGATASFPSAPEVILLTKTATQLCANGTIVQWDVEAGDTRGFFDASTDDELITVPSGVTKIRMSVFLRREDDTDTTDGNMIFVDFRKNGTGGNDFIGNASWAQTTAGDTDTDGGAVGWLGQQVHSGILEVSSGDTFRVRVGTDDYTDDDFVNAECWWEIEVIEAT